MCRLKSMPIKSYDKDRVVARFELSEGKVTAVATPRLPTPGSASSEAKPFMYICMCGLSVWALTTSLKIKTTFYRVLFPMGYYDFSDIKILRMDAWQTLGVCLDFSPFGVCVSRTLPNFSLFLPLSRLMPAPACRAS